jgi:hypothetical protein
MTQTRTKGENLFQQYLATQNLAYEFEKVYPGKSKRPDYTVNWDGKSYLFDVKDFERSDFVFEAGPVPDLYAGIREKIDQARKKFKEYKGSCCSLVVHNLGNQLVNLRDPGRVFGAMYGDIAWRPKRDPQTGKPDYTQTQDLFAGRGKMMRPGWTTPQNTTISAMITLTCVRPSYRVKPIIFRRSHPGKAADLKTSQWTNRPLAKKNVVSASDVAEYEIDSALDPFLLRVPDYEDTRATVPRVIVWHNVGARTRFPLNLFRGPYDVHFAMAKIPQGVEPVIIFAGPKLPVWLRVSKFERPPAQ